VTSGNAADWKNKFIGTPKFAPRHPGKTPSTVRILSWNCDCDFQLALKFSGKYKGKIWAGFSKRDKPVTDSFMKIRHPKVTALLASKLRAPAAASLLVHPQMVAAASFNRRRWFS
jgi:hypothetical protein